MEQFEFYLTKGERASKYAKSVEVGKWYNFPSNSQFEKYAKVVEIIDLDDETRKVIVEKKFEVSSRARALRESRWYDNLPVACY